jgi:CHAT domain-containing protein/Tfp pilus assembly protein PilF
MKRLAAACVMAVSLGLFLAACGGGWAQTPGQSTDEGTRSALDEAQRLNDRILGAFQAGRYEEAIPLARQALELREKALGPDHPDVAQALNNLAALLHEKGDYEGAEPLCRRALAIREKALGPDHPDVALSLNNLAGVLREKGDYGGAELLDRRALAIREKVLGPYHPDVAQSLDNLGELLQEKGDYEGAEPLCRRALAIRETVLGPDHPDVALSLNNLAELLQAEGDLAGAELALRRTLAIREKVLGPDHPDVALTLNNLAGVLQAKGDYAAAAPLFGRALAIREKALGPGHPDVANSLNNMALLLGEQGDHTAAEQLHRRALAIREKALGPDHPEVALSLENLAMRCWANAAPARALPLMQRAAAIREKVLASLLATDSERQKYASAVMLQGDTWGVVSLHVRALPDSADAARLALAVLLQRKGRVLDAMSSTIAQLRARGRSEDQAKLAELGRLGSELARRTLRGPAPDEDVGRHVDALARLRADVERLELELEDRYKALRLERRAVTIDAVQAALDPDAALVEIALFRPVDPLAKAAHRLGEAHYVAYVLRRSGDPGWVELGPAAPIDALVADARKLLGTADPGYAEIARKLDDKVMRPLRPLLGETRDVYLSPDGALNLVPFAALVDERGQLLLARYPFTYLTSGRDLLRLEATLGDRPRSPPLVMGNPAYGADAGSPSDSAALERRPATLDALHFDPLPATELEARAVASLLPDARLRLGEDATAAAVRALAGPSIVHLATHGFFLEPAAEPSRNGPEARALKLITDPGAGPPVPENPLLRSGLALAGANRAKRGTETGVLTALEMTGLDLWGTRLVVLSACDTGVGAVLQSEGVFGLRRALVLAGAESQMTTLWKVDDEATRALMTAYCRELSAGKGRSDALREVQIALAREGAHPFYWAAFIVSGSGRSLSGGEPAAIREVVLPGAAEVTVVRQAADVPAMTQVHPGHAGCGPGCELAGRAGGRGGAGASALAVVGALARRWRRRKGSQHLGRSAGQVAARWIRTGDRR